PNFIGAGSVAPRGLRQPSMLILTPPRPSGAHASVADCPSAAGPIVIDNLSGWPCGSGASRIASWLSGTRNVTEWRSVLSALLTETDIRRRTLYRDPSAVKLAHGRAICPRRLRAGAGATVPPRSKGMSGISIQNVDLDRKR